MTTRFQTCTWLERGLEPVFNYLRQANGAAERNGDPNVVTHPEVDCVDAASHVDLVMQVFTLMHRAEEDNKRKVSNGKFQLFDTRRRRYFSLCFHEMHSSITEHLLLK